MGAFYGSIHLRADEREPICDMLKHLAKRKRRFLVSPPSNGWVSIYPKDRGQDHKVSKTIAKRFGGDVIHLALHDDDVLYYWLYRNGKLIDKYSSCPDYFGPLSKSARTRWNGKAELLAPIMKEGETSATIQEVLDQLRSDSLLLSDIPNHLSSALGISDAWTAYEYLMDGETEGIEHWSQFQHFPDLSKEQKRKERIEAGIAKQKWQFEKDGYLLFEQSKKGDTSRRIIPLITQNQSGPGFFVCWPFPEQSAELERCDPPWKETVPAGLSLTQDPYVMQGSDSGKYLATGHASGTWQAFLWDLQEERLLADIEQSRLVSWVGFANQGQELISVSENRVTVAEVPSGHILRTCELDERQGSGVQGAIHHGSRTLVVGGQIGMTFIDLDTGKARRTFPVVKQDPMVTIREHLDAFGLDLGDIDPAEVTPQILHNAACKQLEKQFGKEAVEEMWQMPATIRSEQVGRLAFSEDGKLLFCEVASGVRVYGWDKIDPDSEDTLIPQLHADATSSTIESEGLSTTMAYTYAMAHDPTNHKLLFAGLAGKIEYLDLESGESGILLTIPGQPAVLDLCLNADATALCCVCLPSFFDNRNQKPAIIQVWSYAKLHDSLQAVPST